MAFIQYRRNVTWDVTLEDLGYGENGLVIDAIKKTTGAPTATAGKFIPGAEITNKVSGVVYRNTGSTASPVWSISPNGVAGIVLAGTATGGTTATRAYTVTGLLATDVVSAVIRASTNAVEIQKATPTANTLTVLFSGDPGASTSVDYVVVRS